MNAKTKRHISHSAKVARAPVRDALDAYNTLTVADGVAAIRTRTGCTVKTARERLDAARAVVDTVHADQRRGEKRRANAVTAGVLSIDDRKSLAIRSMMYGLGGAGLPGEHYSGDTLWRVIPVGRPDVGASTLTTSGDQYSRRCTYRRTDATHRLKICLSDLVAARRTPVPASIDGEIVIRAQSIRENVYQITTIGTKGKEVELRHRFAADQGAGQWYLGKTERGAVTALNRSVRQRESVRLGKVNAATCRGWGWCSAGIRQWCDRHGITRNVAARLRDGATSKAIARLIGKHGGPVNGYERRLIDAAG